MSYRTLRFRTSRFAANGTAPSPCGQDCAEWMRQTLQAGGWRLSTPRATDRGWTMECHAGPQRHELAVGHDPDGWRITLHQPRTLLASFLGRSSRVDGGLEDALQAAVVRDPSIRDVRWFDSDALGRDLLVLARG